MRQAEPWHNQAGKLGQTEGWDTESSLGGVTRQGTGCHLDITFFFGLAILVLASGTSFSLRLEQMVQPFYSFSSSACDHCLAACLFSLTRPHASWRQCLLPLSPGSSQLVLITVAEMNQWMIHEWKKSSSIYIPCPYFPNINSLLLVLFCLFVSLFSEIFLGKVRRPSQTAKLNSISSSVSPLHLFHLHDGLSSLF